MKTVIAPTTKELFFPQNEIVVSKTDLKGRITYANRTFCALAGYGEAELLGQPHSIVRHPDMPRACSNSCGTRSSVGAKYSPM